MRRDTVYMPPEDNFRISSDESDNSTSSSQLELDLNAARLPSDEEEDSDFDIPMTRRQKIITYAKLILPHVGLVLLLLIYLLIGAAIFQRIEGPNEIISYRSNPQTKNYEIQTILGLRDQFQESIWNLTHNSDTIISRETFNGLGQEYFEKLVTEIFNAYRNQFITNMHLLNETSADEHLWTYPNSVFFATTVITTIGYGHLVPMTPTGRVFCIGFALVGIPLLLVTIADIGQFLSEFLNYLHLTIRSFEQKVRKHSRRISHFRRNRTQSQSGRSDAESSGDKAGSINLNDMTEEIEEEPNPKQPLRIPILMVLVVILSYTALGGLLFQKFEGWPYMEAFYFCFITMATIGFGDYVPTKQVYIFFTMIYIIFGLSLATMCIDTAGTHYIRKIHYVGTKMEDAKGAVMTGLQHSEQVLKHKGIEIIKTAGGKIYKVRGAMLSKTQARELDYLLRSSQYQQKNILYEPLPPAILPDDISETEGYIVQNKDYEKQVTKQFLQQQRSPNTIHRFIRRPGRLDAIPTLMPFVLKESNI
ncbi:TWiK family of potassium channels protein 7 [Aphelenchoides besseyi]|nr:TWiK family of potassium channels protein 7 [Aphelenchoides besseyi]